MVCGSIDRNQTKESLHFVLLKKTKITTNFVLTVLNALCLSWMFFFHFQLMQIHIKLVVWNSYLLHLLKTSPSYQTALTPCQCTPPGSWRQPGWQCRRPRKWQQRRPKPAPGHGDDQPAMSMTGIESILRFWWQYQFLNLQLKVSFEQSIICQLVTFNFLKCHWNLDMCSFNLLYKTI